MPKRKSRTRTKPTPRVTVTPQQFSQRLQAICLAMLMALFVATPLVPSEAVATHGTGAVLVTLWMVLFLFWAVASAAQPKFAIRWGWTEVAVVLLAVPIVLSM